MTRELLDTIKEEQHGHIFGMDQALSVAQIDDQIQVSARIKGKYGDRPEPWTGTLQDFIQGAFLKEGEFVTQLWLKS